MTVMVGGVSELFQSDLDLGRLAIERLQLEGAGRDTLVEELHYGAIAVAQRLEDVRPDTLVLVSAVRRDRQPGSVERRLIDPPALTPAQVQAAVGDAVTGYVHVDLVIDVATGLGVLPRRTVTVEVEPEKTTSGEGLSRSAEAGLEVALDLVRTEVDRAHLFRLAADLTTLSNERAGSAAGQPTGQDILAELTQLDHGPGWATTDTLRDRLRSVVAGPVSSAADVDRDLWRELLAELERLESSAAPSTALDPARTDSRCR